MISFLLSPYFLFTIARLQMSLTLSRYFPTTIILNGSMCPLPLFAGAGLLFAPSGAQNADGIAERTPSTERVAAAVFLTKFFIKPFPSFLTYYAKSRSLISIIYSFTKTIFIGVNFTFIFYVI